MLVLTSIVIILLLVAVEGGAYQKENPVLQEVRTRCYRDVNSTTIFKLEVNANDALSKINLAMTRITDRKDRRGCEAFEEQCPPRFVWYTQVNGDISDLFTDSNSLAGPDRSLLTCSIPFLTNTIAIGDDIPWAVWSPL